MKKCANIVTNVKAEQENRENVFILQEVGCGVGFLDKSSLLVKLTFVSRMSLNLYADLLPQSSILLVNESPPSFHSQQAQYVMFLVCVPGTGVHK
jgi:hypothetical protein